MRRKNIVTTMSIHVETMDKRNTVFRQREMTDGFSREEYELSDGTVEVAIVDPVHMLLNQERLNKVVGNTAQQAFIDSFRNQQHDPFTELRSQCSDSDLIAMVKSRHLQSPCEILSWANYMKSNIDTFNSELQALIEAQQPNVEPDKNE